MSSLYIKSDGAVVTAPQSQAGTQVAVLNEGSGGSQLWHFTNDGYLVLASSPELCLSVSSNPLGNGNQVLLQQKGAVNNAQTWGYNDKKSQIYLLENNEFLLDNGSGGPAGPTVFIDKQTDVNWVLEVASQSQSD